ncbi:hypothetical protein HMPREF9594_00592 [Cutibacterium acnes HL005PA1]|nr:hypothetical protein HMPREF0675_3169 [Cutibacterium acnes SK137]EFS70653.1 hypothetical protein HMPREF9617_02360 [Cutibacterium acnes HL056PA1]EFS77513.1 hypothetical protein HMPREF9591_00940 [Cutibacterium acnes HL086PA1]EFT29325.1 hypothetical protein HMPREF9594_00592 [Cutibacterium acnes HL005PA1]EFT68963.1 hypothetical protein HMPREF9583_00678 [Cutibacterium acnes HL038PA1]EGR94619.1 hypothetical protein HMPREF9205_1097 [Cutibacterium acnes SK182]
MFFFGTFLPHASRFSLAIQANLDCERVLIGSVLIPRGNDPTGLVCDLTQLHRLPDSPESRNLEHPDIRLSRDLTMGDHFVGRLTFYCRVHYFHSFGIFTPARSSCARTPTDVSWCPAGIDTRPAPPGRPQISWLPLAFRRRAHP